MNILIKDYSVESPSNGKRYISYLVVCKYKSTQWTVKKRFSQFYNLNGQLTKKFGNNETFKKLQKFPQKIIFGNMKMSNVNKRKEKLQNYLHDIMHCPLTNVSKEVSEFLDIASNVNEKIDKFTVEQKKSKVESYNALYSYEGKDEEELNFSKGDILVVIEKHDSGWWFGYKKGNDSKQGFFPAAFTDGVKPDDEGSEMTENTTSIKTDDGQDQEIEDSDEETLDVNPSDDYQMTEKERNKKLRDAKAFSVRLHDREVPRNPSQKLTKKSIVQIQIPSSSEVNQQSKRRVSSIRQVLGETCVVVYDFTADQGSEGEISVKTDDICERIKTNDGWAYIYHLKSTKYGWVPEDYLELQK